jgi:hypothetical protein
MKKKNSKCKEHIVAWLEDWYGNKFDLTLKESFGCEVDGKYTHCPKCNAKLEK